MKRKNDRHAALREVRETLGRTATEKMALIVSGTEAAAATVAYHVATFEQIDALIKREEEGR